MIPFNFEYYKPDNISEAVKLFDELDLKGKKPIYYGGGTEFISMARANNIYSEAVIDIKGLSECIAHELKEGELSIGAAVTLTQIAEANLFPLLGLTVKRIADHTIQDKITLGGNISGTIIYREAVLPLLVSDSNVVIAGTNGIRIVPIMEAFRQRIILNRGEFIIKFIIKENFLNLPFLHVKRTKNDKIDYPLITLAALKCNNSINIAFSGLFQYPFRSILIEKHLNNTTLQTQDRIIEIINSISDNILSDLNGSAEYKKFVLQIMLSEVIEKLEGVK